MKMKRRWALYFGLFVFAIPQVLLVAFGLPVLASSSAVTYLGMTLAGVLFLVAGLRERVTVGPLTLRWYQFVGVADVLMALVMMSTAVLGIRGSTEELVYAGAAVVGGLSLVWIGFDIARGGKHFDLGDEPSTE